MLRRFACLLAASFLLLSPHPAELAAQDEPDIFTLHEQAERRVAAGRPEHALEIYHDILEADPTDSVAIYNIAELSRALGNPVDCALYFRRLTYLVPAEAPGVAEPLAGCAEELAGALTVTAQPDEAMIVVDGLEMGEGRLEALPLLAGSHHVSVEAYDYEPWSTEVEIRQGQSPELTVELEPIIYRGSVEIVCDRPGATITLEGEPVGTCPLDDPIQVLARRPYLVRLALEGFHDWVRRIQLEPDEAMRLEITMQEIDPWEERFRETQ